MVKLRGNALKRSDSLDGGAWGQPPVAAPRFDSRNGARLSARPPDRTPGARFYFSGKEDARQLGGWGDRLAAAMPADRRCLRQLIPQDGVRDDSEDTLLRFSQGIAQHVNDLLMAVLGQSALCRLDAPRSAQLAAMLNKIEGLVQYGAHLTLHLLGLCGRGVFADPPYVAESGNRLSEGIIGYARERERFRSFPFYHLSAAFGRRPLSKDAVHTVCRQLSREYLIVFDHLIAAMDAIPPEAVHHRAAAMRRMALKGRRLMVEIAAYAGGDPRGRRGKDVTMPEAVATILRGVLRRIAAGNPALKVTMSMGISLPALKMLPGDFRHVVAAVVKNAAEAMPSGGSLTVTVTVTPCTGDRSMALGLPATSLEIAVCDTGSGIPEGAGQRIFDPFFTLKKGRGRFGLGLAGSLGRLQQVGGAMMVASEPGKGTVALIRIPGAAGKRRSSGVAGGHQRLCAQTPVCCAG